MTTGGEQRLLEGSRGAWWGIGGNFILAILKGFVGIIAGSKAMLADSLHSATDLVGSLVTLVAFRIGNKPPDACHPYGHGKAESLAGKIIGIMLILSGINVAWLSMKGIVSWRTIEIPGVLALYAAVISLVVKESMFQYKIRLGKRLQSTAIMANAWEHRSDAYTSVAALIGISGARLGYPVLDPLAGFIVALVVVWVGIQLMTKAIAELMDKVPDPNLVNEVASLAANVDGVQKVERVWLRPMGAFVFAELTIGVASNLSVKEGHRISTCVRDLVLSKEESIVRVFIHVNPL